MENKELIKSKGEMFWNKTDNDLDSYDKIVKYTNLVMKEAQKELLKRLLKAEERINQDKYIKSSYLRIELKSINFK